MLIMILILCLTVFMSQRSNACDYAFPKEYNISNTRVSDSIIFDNEDAISIEFELKLFEDCGYSCNIFTFQLDQDPLLQFTIEAWANYIQISNINNQHFIEDIFIPNANQILPSDSQYHTINIIMSQSIKQVLIDGCNEYISIILHPRSYRHILLSSINSYPLIINDPPSSKSIGSIRNICISSIGSNSNTTVSVAANESNYVFIQDRITWFSAELFCQNNFGTHLATIISDQDIKEAIKLVNHTNNFISDNFDIWIGLNDILNHGKYVWIDETSCDYVSSGDCNDDPHWLYLYKSKSSLNRNCGQINSNYISDDNKIFKHSLCDSEDRSAGFLCNGMSATYHK